MDGRHADVKPQNVDARTIYLRLGFAKEILLAEEHHAAVHFANAAIFTFFRAENNDAGFGDQSHWRLAINLEN